MSTLSAEEIQEALAAVAVIEEAILYLEEKLPEDVQSGNYPTDREAFTVRLRRGWVANQRKKLYEELGRVTEAKPNLFQRLLRAKCSVNK